MVFAGAAPLASIMMLPVVRAEAVIKPLMVSADEPVYERVELKPVVALKVIGLAPDAEA